MRAVGLVAVQALGHFPQPNAAEKPSRGGKMADHHLIHPGPCPFRRTGLGLFPACRRYAVSGGRFRGRLQHLGFFIQLSSLLQHLRMQTAIVCSKSRCQLLGYVHPVFEDVASAANMRMTFPSRELLTFSFWRIVPFSAMMTRR